MTTPYNLDMSHDELLDALAMIDDDRQFVAVNLVANACRGTWLRRMADDVVLSRFVEVVDNDGTAFPYAIVDWDALGAAIDEGRIVGSSGELQVLAVACSIGGDHRVNLRFLYSGLDEGNRRAVADALGSLR